MRFLRNLFKFKDLAERPANSLSVEPVKKNKSSWLFQNFPDNFFIPSQSEFTTQVEDLAEQTNQLGELPLWEGYEKVKGLKYSEQQHPFRNANQVRTKKRMGNLFTHLIRLRQPAVIVEFGTAFGVSGMYWLAGLELNNYGELLTFEPNSIWAELARKNLVAIGNRFQLCEGTFEQNIDALLGESRAIDMAFIDAIHTSEFVRPQFELVVERLAPNGLILFDDVDFSQDMKSCWDTIVRDRRVLASLLFSRRVGIVELAK